MYTAKWTRRRYYTLTSIFIFFVSLLVDALNFAIQNLPSRHPVLSLLLGWKIFMTRDVVVLIWPFTFSVDEITRLVLFSIYHLSTVDHVHHPLMLFTGHALPNLFWLWIHLTCSFKCVFLVVLYRCFYLKIYRKRWSKFGLLCHRHHHAQQNANTIRLQCCFYSGEIRWVGFLW